MFGDLDALAVASPAGEQWRVKEGNGAGRASETLEPSILSHRTCEELLEMISLSFSHRTRA